LPDDKNQGVCVSLEEWAAQTLKNNISTVLSNEMTDSPLKDKSRIWQNYFCLQIKLICILYKYLLLFGSFVVLTKINCLFFSD
jgi:hypothetical protein